MMKRCWTVLRRWWGIRHVRWFCLSVMFAFYVDWCQRKGLGIFPNESDLEFLDGVWKGEN
jgi:hypothetical protein